MLKLKGQTELGEWVEFYVGDIKDANYDYTEIRIYNGDTINDIITATIQLADDQRKAMLDEIRNQLSVLQSPESGDDYFDDGFGEAAHKVFDLIDEMEAKL